jgi:hypothetical protein
MKRKATGGGDGGGQQEGVAFPQNENAPCWFACFARGICTHKHTRAPDGFRLAFDEQRL